MSMIFGGDPVNGTRISATIASVLFVIAVVFGTLYSLERHHESVRRQELWNVVVAEMNMASYDIGRYGTSDAVVPVATAAESLEQVVQRGLSESRRPDSQRIRIRGSHF